MDYGNRKRSIRNPSTVRATLFEAREFYGHVFMKFIFMDHLSVAYGYIQLQFPLAPRSDRVGDMSNIL